jgi:hypothetical protein
MWTAVSAEAERKTCSLPDAPNRQRVREAGAGSTLR